MVENKELLNSISSELTQMKSLVEDMAARPRLERADLSFCEHSLRLMESRLRKLQARPGSSFSDLAVCNMLNRI